MDPNEVLFVLFVLLVSGVFIGSVVALGCTIRQYRTHHGLTQYWDTAVITPPASPYHAMPPSSLPANYPDDLDVRHKYPK